MANGAAKATTLASSVFEQLREAILTGAIAPGEKLKTEILRKTYDAGLSPVREALNRLVAEGLVVQQDQRGFYVSTVSTDELDDITRTRCLIGEFALRAAIAKGGPDWEEGIVVAFHRFDRYLGQKFVGPSVDFQDRSNCHRAFHTSLLAACGSLRLLSFWHTLFDQAQRYQSLFLERSPGQRDPRREHRELMEAVLDRDVERAVELHNAHIQRTVELVTPAFDKAEKPTRPLRRRPSAEL